MKLPRWAWYALIWCAGALVQYSFSLNPYFLLLLVCVSMFVCSELYAHVYHSQRTKENRELQEEVRTTAKDAHLKNKQLLTVVSSIPFPMLLIDQFGNIVMHNSLKEISREEVRDDHPLSYVHNDFFHSVQEFIKDAFILEKLMDKIIEIDRVEYQAISIPVMAKGRYSGCLILLQNISKTLEGEKMQKRFVADASHELKTPIAVIKGMVEILNREDFDDDKTQKEFLEQIELEINRLDVLVKDLLQLSRLSLSNVILQREKTDVSLLIDQVFRSFKKKAQQKQLTLRKECKSEEALFCDPKRMEQLLINLVGNAVKYSDKGEIVVRTYTKGVYYIVEVEDEGCGLKEEDLAKIFERFYRVDDARLRKNGGFGLGLPIVKSIMDAHGGRIEVSSVYGRGSCFRLIFHN